MIVEPHIWKHNNSLVVMTMNVVTFKASVSSSDSSVVGHPTKEESVSGDAEVLLRIAKLTDSIVGRGIGRKVKSVIQLQDDESFQRLNTSLSSETHKTFWNPGTHSIELLADKQSSQAFSYSGTQVPALR